MGSLQGRVAVVTGAAGGIGGSICEVLQREGARVLPVDLRGDASFHADVATDEGNQAMIAAALQRFGRLDILVLNAGVQFVSPIPDFPEAEWDRLMNVMAKGPFLAMKHAWPYLTERPGGRIVVTSSLSGFLAEPHKAAYVAAKHAVLGLVRVAALEGASLGLTTNAVAPGWVRTPLVESQIVDHMRLRGLTYDEVIEGMVGGTPARRFVTPQEVAEVVAFLASPAASGLNGVCVPVDIGDNIQ